MLKITIKLPMQKFLLSPQEFIEEKIYIKISNYLEALHELLSLKSKVFSSIRSIPAFFYS